MQSPFKFSEILIQYLCLSFGRQLVANLIYFIELPAYKPLVYKIVHIRHYIHYCSNPMHCWAQILICRVNSNVDILHGPQFRTSYVHDVRSRHQLAGDAFGTWIVTNCEVNVFYGDWKCPNCSIAFLGVFLGKGQCAL